VDGPLQDAVNSCAFYASVANAQKFAIGDEGSAQFFRYTCYRGTFDSTVVECTSDYNNFGLYYQK
jgi:hypothetical protein